MIAKTHNSELIKSDWALRLFNGYVYSIASTFGLIGIVLLFAAFHGNDRWLQQQDALWGLVNWIVLALAGAFHLALCGFLFESRNLINQVIMPLWVGSNYFVYSFGMAWGIKMPGPLPEVQFVARQMAIAPATLDACWNLFIVYLTIGGFVLLFLKLRRSKELRNEAWFKNWLRMRELSNIPKKTAIQKSPSNTNNYIKLSCRSCSGHIEFPIHALGQTIPCPHCAKTITLLKPT